MADCPWCDGGFVGDIRTAVEKGHLVAPLVLRTHNDGCVVDLVVRERGSTSAEEWLQNVERYVQTYVLREIGVDRRHA